VRIVVDLTMAIDASCARRPAPWAMAGCAIIAELVMSDQQRPGLVTGARRE
jgi:hypothetical protein